MGWDSSHFSVHFPLPPSIPTAPQEVEELHAKRFTEKVLRSVSELVGALDGVTLNADIIPPCECTCTELIHAYMCTNTSALCGVKVVRVVSPVCVCPLLCRWK